MTTSLNQTFYPTVIDTSKARCMILNTYLSLDLNLFSFLLGKLYYAFSNQARNMGVILGSFPSLPAPLQLTSPMYFLNISLSIHSPANYMSCVHLKLIYFSPSPLLH